MRPLVIASFICLTAGPSAWADPPPSAQDVARHHIQEGARIFNTLRSPFSEPEAADTLVSTTIAIPLYDVEARCRSGAAGLPGICIDAEQRDYDVAKWLWGALSPDQQAKCARHVQSPQPRRYAAVRGCAELEASLNDLAQRQATKRFRP